MIAVAKQLQNRKLLVSFLLFFFSNQGSGFYSSLQNISLILSNPIQNREGNQNSGRKQKTGITEQKLSLGESGGAAKDC